ncbi:MAG TPA: hypothetical protein VEP68_05095 [Anaeromyxobacteraceae bacterium]|nr:hypothetical protein [Anaeromyxobacteraceae bacterium]
MLRRYLLLALLAGAVLGLAAYWMRRQIAADRCLATGGRWDSARGACQTSSGR